MHQRALRMSHSYCGAQQRTHIHTLLTTVSEGPTLCKIHLASVSKLNFHKTTKLSTLLLVCSAILSENHTALGIRHHFVMSQGEPMPQRYLSQGSDHTPSLVLAALFSSSSERHVGDPGELYF